MFRRVAELEATNQFSCPHRLEHFGSPDLNAHPTTAVLVVEVSDDTLQHDRTVKRRLYARCGIPEYWILGLPEARLEIYRDPAEDGYHTVTRHGADDTVAPLGRPDAQVYIADLLP